MGMKILLTVSILVTAYTTVKSCALSESGPSPYLIRIYDSGTDLVTYGHGSLIRQDKVLSTCAPFKDLPNDSVNGKWRLSGYNFKEKCEQKRHPLEIKIHDACKKPDPNTIEAISLDLAIWTVEPFTVEGMPFLWGNEQPPPLASVESLLNSLVKKNTDCQTAVFKEPKAESSELQPETTVKFIDRSECMDMLENITSISHTGDGYGAGSIDIFCVYDRGIAWIDSPQNASDPIDADWYSGAAVVVAEDNASNNGIPIGLLSRGITVTKSLPAKTNFRIVMGFHRGVYEFLIDSGIETTESSSKTTIALNHADNTKPLHICDLIESGPHPYLIRISETYTKGSITYGHGSLIKEDKVLSTCTPFKHLPKDLKKTNWTLTGYNFERRCKQQREPKEIIMHESCHDTSFIAAKSPITHDFAIWKVEAFEIVGKPFLWGNGKPQPPPLASVRSIVDSLVNYRKALVFGLFEDRSSDGPELQSDTKSNFINWFVCLDMIQNITNATGDMTNGLSSNTSKIQGFYEYFCGYDVRVKWVNPRSNMSSPTMKADWYSGAAVMYEHISGNKIPIGFLSRGVTIRPAVQNIKNFRIVMGFHESVYQFLSEHGIEASAVLQTDFKYQFSTSTNKWSQEAAGPRLRKSPNQYNHQSRLSSRHSRIFHLTLLGCNMLMVSSPFV